MHTESNRLRLSPLLAATLCLGMTSACQSGGEKRPLAPSLSLPGPPDPGDFTDQDRLRGSITPERSWWNVLHYDLDMEIMPATKSIKGTNRIKFFVRRTGKRMQIDLQEPLAITKVLHRDKELKFEREGNVYWVNFPFTLGGGAKDEILVHFEGTPVESERPPWSGGFTWTEDAQGRPLIATTCQGLGASVWWPNKDHGGDEPDQGVTMTWVVPDELIAVGNGRLVKTERDVTQELKHYHWNVTHPINNYCVNANIGHYVAIDGVYAGEAGPIDTQYWVLDYEEEKARKHFVEVERTLEAFEHWFGPYPFPEDSYKLVSVPYLGMEHQSSVTYGNGFENGYRGRDLSKTGVGMLFDYIIVHETAHEWFGNNISMKDSADMWIHESFADYAESLFVEYHFSKEQAQDYIIGLRDIIRNDEPIIGAYGFNDTGSSDMYPKGANILHTLRHALGDDERWREILRGMNQEFRYKTIDTQAMEGFLATETGLELGGFFDQYLRTSAVPTLRFERTDDGVDLWFENVVESFQLPVVVEIDGAPMRVTVSRVPVEVELETGWSEIEVDRNFYVQFEG